MARLLTAGFEAGDGSELTVCGSTISGPGHTGDYCIFPTWTNDTQFDVSGSEFYIRQWVNGVDGDRIFLHWYGNDWLWNHQAGLIGCGTDNVKVWIAPKNSFPYQTPTVQSAAGTWTLNTWHLVEIHLKLSAVGPLVVKVDGVTVINYTDETRFGGNTSVIALAFDGRAGGPAFDGWSCYVDDIAVNDPTGDSDNGWPGDGRIIGLRPNDAGALTQWTPSAGSNWECVDERPPNSDTDYVASSTLSQRDSYALTATGLVDVEILRVWEHLRARKTAADATSLATLLRTHGQSYLGNAQVLTTSYARYQSADYTTNPNVDEAWTLSELDSLEAGVVATSGNEHRVTQALVMVEYRDQEEEMGLEAFRKIQIGQESTAGTAVAATAKLHGGRLSTYREARKVELPAEDRGYLARNVRSRTASVQAALTYEGDALFEDIIYFLLMAVKGGVEPAYSTPSNAFHNDNGVITAMANAIDDDTGTSYALTLVAAEDSIVIGSASKFRGIRFDLGATVNAIASTVTVQSSDGAAGWLATTLVRDRTIAATGKSLSGDGIIEFTPADTWATDTYNAVGGKYWVKLTWSSNLTPAINILEVDVVPLACVWTFTAPVLTYVAPTTFTLEYGDDVQVWEAEYCFATTLSLAGSPEEALKLRADLVGRQHTATTWTAGLADRTIESALFQLTKIYVDDAVMGDTVQSGLLCDFDLKLGAGYTPKRRADGVLYYSGVSYQKRAAELDLTLEFNSAANTERGKWVSETRRKVRLLTEGSEIWSGGTKKSIRVDFWGKYIDWDTLDSKDGTDTVRVKLQSEYLTADAKDLEIVVTNAIATLP